MSGWKKIKIWKFFEESLQWLDQSIPLVTDQQFAGFPAREYIDLVSSQEVRLCDLGPKIQEDSNRSLDQLGHINFVHANPKYSFYHEY